MYAVISKGKLPALCERPRCVKRNGEMRPMWGR